MNNIEATIEIENIEVLKKLVKQAQKESAQLQRTIEQIQVFEMNINAHLKQKTKVLND